MTPWIKMRTNLLDDPRVRVVAKRVGCNAISVTGGLYMLWSLADQYSVDGRLLGYDEAEIDKRFGKAGFAAALADSTVAWLEIGHNYIAVPRFEEHNGESAKARAGVQKRVQAHRVRNGESVTKSLPEIEKNKSREEEKKDLSANADADAVEGKGQVDRASKRERKPASGAHHETVRTFCDAWKAKYHADYRFVDGKDGKHVKWLLEAVGDSVAEVAKAIEAFLADGDQFVTDKRHPIGLLVSGFNKYRADVALTNGHKPRPKEPAVVIYQNQ